MLEILKRNRPLRVLSLRNKLLCNAMVRILLESALFTRQFSQVAFGRQAAALLQPSTQVCIPAALAFNTLPAVAFAVAIRGKVCDTQVNPKHAVNRLFVRFRHITHGQQIERTTMVDQIALTLTRLQQRALMLARAVGNILASRECPDRDGALVGVPSQVAVIESDSAVGVECALRLAIQFVGISDLGDTANEDLCAQAKRCFDVVVDELLKGKATKLLLLPRGSTNRVARGVRFCQGGEKRRVLLRRRVQLYLRDEFHTI